MAGFPVMNLKFLAIGAVAMLPVGYLLFQLGVGDLLGLGGGSSAACKKAQPLTAPTLAKFYDYAHDHAIAWKPDAVPARLDNLAITSPLAPDGSSRLWTAGFYSPASDSSMLIHSGDGTVNCRTMKGDIAGRVPAFKGELMRDGVALYKIAEMNGKPQLEKGLGVGISLGANYEDKHGVWGIAFYDKQGNSSGPGIIVNASTGTVEEVEKAK